MLYLWKLYCLPGRIIAWLEYFFPGRGQVWASGRRKDNEIVHFLFSTAVYAFLGYLAWSQAHKSPPPRTVSALEASPPTVAAPENASSLTSTTEATAPGADQGDVEGSPTEAEPAAESDAYWLKVDERKCEQAAMVAVTDVRCPTERMRSAGWTDEHWTARVREIICEVGSDAEKAEASCPKEDKLASAREITNPDWLRRPTADDVARYYPEGASRDGVSGRVTLSCQVTAQGRLEGCSVESEAPSDQDFGLAALRMSRLFRMRPTTADGEPVGGTKIRIPIRFSTAADF